MPPYKIHKYGNNVTTDYEAILIEQCRLRFEQYGPQGDYSMMPKSHWRGCGWAGRTSVLMPPETPAELISCDACLLGRGYIRIVHCNPQVEGWPYDDRKCENCDYGGIDCETWLRVKGIGEGVEKALRRLDPKAIHPVTWTDIGLVPFKDGPDPLFDDKAALDDYCTRFLRDHPNECAYLSTPDNTSFLGRLPVE